MKFAFVENGVVQEAWSRDPFELFVPGYASQFIACPEDVQSGWTFDGTNWAAPEPVVVEPAKAPTKVELLAKLQELQAQIAALS